MSTTGIMALLLPVAIILTIWFLINTARVRSASRNIERHLDNLIEHNKKLRESVEDARKTAHKLSKSF